MATFMKLITSSDKGAEPETIALHLPPKISLVFLNTIPSHNLWVYPAPDYTFYILVLNPILNMPAYTP